MPQKYLQKAEFDWQLETAFISHFSILATSTFTYAIISPDEQNAAVHK